MKYNDEQDILANCEGSIVTMEEIEEIEVEYMENFVVSNTHTWSAMNMERRSSDDIVEVVHWSCLSTDGTNFVTSHGTTNHTISTDDLDYIPYEDLTEADVLQLVWAEVSQTEVEADNDTHLLEISNPTTSHGLPWES